MSAVAALAVVLVLAVALGRLAVRERPGWHYWRRDGND